MVCYSELINSFRMKKRTSGRLYQVSFTEHYYLWILDLSHLAKDCMITVILRQNSKESNGQDHASGSFQLSCISFHPLEM